MIPPSSKVDTSPEHKSVTSNKSQTIEHEELTSNERQSPVQTDEEWETLKRNRMKSEIPEVSESKENDISASEGIQSQSVRSRGPLSAIQASTSDEPGEFYYSCHEKMISDWVGRRMEDNISVR